MPRSGNSLFTLLFWRVALERVLKTVAQAAGALLVANGTGLLETDWASALSVAGMAGVISLLTSVGFDVATGGTGPSLVGEEQYVGEHRRDERGATDLQHSFAVTLLLVAAAGVVLYLLLTLDLLT